MYRRTASGLEVLLVHPGGPHSAAARTPGPADSQGRARARRRPCDPPARREAGEELGVKLDGPLLPLGDIRQTGGKMGDRLRNRARHPYRPPSAATNSKPSWPPGSDKQPEIPRSFRREAG